MDTEMGYHGGNMQPTRFTKQEIEDAIAQCSPGDNPEKQSNAIVRDFRIKSSTDYGSVIKTYECEAYDGTTLTIKTDIDLKVNKVYRATIEETDFETYM